MFVWHIFLSFYWDTAADEDDVKSQLDKLWQEVNSLKEIQALQTGTTLTHSSQGPMKNTVAHGRDTNRLKQSYYNPCLFLKQNFVSNLFTVEYWLIQGILILL